MTQFDLAQDLCACAKHAALLHHLLHVVTESVRRKRNLYLGQELAHDLYRFLVDDEHGAHVTRAARVLAQVVDPNARDVLREQEQRFRICGEHAQERAHFRIVVVLRADFTRLRLRARAQWQAEEGCVVGVGLRIG